MNYPNYGRTKKGGWGERDSNPFQNTSFLNILTMSFDGLLPMDESQLALSWLRFARLPPEAHVNAWRDHSFQRDGSEGLGFFTIARKAPASPLKKAFVEILNLTFPPFNQNLPVSSVPLPFCRWLMIQITFCSQVLDFKILIVFKLLADLDLLLIQNGTNTDIH